MLYIGSITKTAGEASDLGFLQTVCRIPRVGHYVGTYPIQRAMDSQQQRWSHKSICTKEPGASLKNPSHADGVILSLETTSS